MIIYDKSSEAPIKKNELSEYFLELTHRINSEASWKVILMLIIFIIIIVILI